MLYVVGEGSRDGVVTVLDHSLSEARVTRDPGDPIRRRWQPDVFVSDNGTEMTSRAVRRSCQDAGGGTHDNAPGSPNQNAFVESFGECR